MDYEFLIQFEGCKVTVFMKSGLGFYGTILEVFDDNTIMEVSEKKTYILNSRVEAITDYSPPKPETTEEEKEEDHGATTEH